MMESFEPSPSSPLFASDSFETLLSVKAERRGPEWERAFLRALPAQRFRVLGPEPRQGPDGWPYLFVSTGPEADEAAQGPLRWLSDKGIGMAVNPSGEAPDFVLTYGMIWNFRERDEFITAEDASPTEALSIENGRTFFTGTPSDAYLPAYVRSVLRQFFLDQGAFAPKILMISEALHGPFDLAFSAESLGSPPQREHAGILEALSWFLPAHYRLALVSERVISGPWQSI